MAQYINKDKVVAEIERKKKYAQTLGDNAFYSSIQQFYDGMKQGCVDILSFLDTLEVKEVDLDKEIYKFIDKEELHLRLWDVDRIAKHFFKLGLKTQKGEQLYTPKDRKKISVEREVKTDAGGYPYIPQIELYDYEKDIPLAKVGDKVKVIIMKGG